MINELTDNSIDEAIRTNFKFANKIDISIVGNSLTVTDNGRGIPQEEIHDSQTNTKILRPVAAWTRVNAGTSFEDTRVTIGANGVGSAATNFLSATFVGKTWQNGKLIEVHCSNGAEEINVKEKTKSGNGTSVTFTPDFSFFEVKALDELDTVALIEDRLIGLQMAFPEITFSFNGKRIQVRDIKHYAELFAEEGASVILEKNENLSFFFTSSNDGFRSNSFVNGVNTRLGGTYVDHIVNNIVDELLILIKKKHKIEVAKSVVKNGITFVAFARNFVNPKYDSQTKERLTNSIGEVRTHYEENVTKDFKYFAKKIFAAPDIIEPIIAAQIAKKNADDKRNAIVAQKKLKKRIEKLKKNNFKIYEKRVSQHDDNIQDSIWNLDKIDGIVILKDND
jgi:DNA topoisomerase-2